MVSGGSQINNITIQYRALLFLVNFDDTPGLLNLGLFYLIGRRIKHFSGLVNDYEELIKGSLGLLSNEFYFVA